MVKGGNASGKQRTLSSAVDNPRDRGQKDEAVVHTLEGTDSVAVSLMERVVERENLRAALTQVRRNKGGRPS